MALSYVVLALAAIVSAIVDGAVDSRRLFDQQMLEDALDPQLCDQQLTVLANHSLRYQFLDASAKLPSGVLTGNLNDLGDYYQCLGIHQTIENLDIQGKYCTVIVPFDQDPIDWPDLPEWPELPEWPDFPNITWPELPGNQTDNPEETYARLQLWARKMAGQNQDVAARVVPLAILASLGMTLAVCVPRACSAAQAIQFVQQQVPFLDVQFHEYFCRLPGDKPWATADYVAIVIFSIIGLMIILSTAYDLCHLFVFKRDPSAASKLYRSFSVYTNTARLLTFNSPPGALECVDGIRAISMLWVVVGHTYSFSLLGYIHNTQDIISWLSAWSSVWVVAAPITVDTFFLLSGILAVYTTVGKISRARFMRTVHMFYVNRLLRMFPLLATVVLLQASLMMHFSDGPFWENVAAAAGNCRNWWWSALLHVQNYVNNLEVCLPHSWYLSVDTQMYVVSPLVVMWLFAGGAGAWTALIFALLATLVASSVYSYLYNFPAVLINPARMSEFNDYMTVYYINTLARASSFVVGLMYGYVLHQWRGRKIHIPKMQAWALWVLSLALMAFCVFSIYPAMQPVTTQQFDNFLNAYMRAVWALALGWLIFACVQGYGGPVDWFLSLRMWKLPARLSFAMYLIHLPLIIVANGSWVKTHYFSNGDTMYRFLSDLSLTFVAAFILCVCVDAPCSTLQKLLLGGGKKPRAPPVKVNREVDIANNEKYIIKTAL